MFKFPSWRPDSSIEEDVIEEVARHYGYDKIEKRVPKSPQAGMLTPDQNNRRKVRRVIRGLGLSEAMPMPFLAPGDIEKAGLSSTGISLMNPLVSEESILRTSLLPGLLKTIAYNQSHRAESVSLYELGAVFENGEPGSELPNETEQLALIKEGFDDTGSALNCAVGWLNAIGSELAIDSFKLTNKDKAEGLHPTRSSQVFFRGKVIGGIGEVDPGVLESYGVSGRVAWLNIAMQPILDALVKSSKYKTISRFPSSDFDLAFLVPKSVSAEELHDSIKKAGGALVTSIKLFDVFHSQDLGESRSLAYSLRLQAPDRTLTDAEVAKVRDACIAAAKKFHKAELR